MGRDIIKDKIPRLQLALWLPVPIIEELDKIVKNIGLDRTKTIPKMIEYFASLSISEQIKILKDL